MAQRQRARLITARTLDQNQFSVSNIIISHRCIKALEQPSRRSSEEERLKTRLLHHDSKSPNQGWLSAHNGEDVRSKLTAGIYYTSPALQKLVVIAQATSKLEHYIHCKPAWRSGQRAGLITPRSLDRNELPVSHPLVVLQKLLVTSHQCIKALEQTTPIPCSSAAERLKHRPLSTKHANVRI